MNNLRPSACSHGVRLAADWSRAVNWKLSLKCEGLSRRSWDPGSGGAGREGEWEFGGVSHSLLSGHRGPWPVLSLFFSFSSVLLCRHWSPVTHLPGHSLALSSYLPRYFTSGGLLVI